MQKTKKPNFLNWNYNTLISSFKKINIKDAVLILVLDALFYIFSGYIFLFWLQRINEKMESVYLPFDLATAGVEKVQQAAKDAQSFYYLLIFSIILLVIAVVFLSSIFKGIIWAKTTSTKITSKLISKFFMLNFLWLGFWFVLIFLISWIVDIKYALAFMAASVLMGFYFTNNLYPLFMINPSIKSIKSSLKLSITKIHLFLLPYALIFIGFYLALFVSSLTKLDTFSAALAQKIYGFLGFSFGAAGALGLPAVSGPELAIGLLVGILANPLLLLFAALARYYISTLAAEISKAK